MGSHRFGRRFVTIRVSLFAKIFSKYSRSADQKRCSGVNHGKSPSSNLRRQDLSSNQPVGTFLHIAHEEGLILNSSIHAGIRAPLLRRKGDIRNDLRCGFDIIKARDIDRIGVDGVIERLKKRVGDTNVYISVDIDVLDPAFAPATGTAEIGGWSSRELLSILDGLEGTNVIGADVVEVAPIYDNPGETTVLAAAEIVHSLLTL